MDGVIFVGLQASGKSSFFLKHLYKTHLRLNMDMLKTRNRERILFEACLQAKQPVVIDNTNPTKKERQKYIEKFILNRFTVTGYYFSSSIEQCLTRNMKREEQKRVPDVAIKGTYNKLELPSYSEGFNKLFYVTIKNGLFKMDDWKNEI
ncbi:MAG: AAA family ATPase [Candidatus Thiodiazotropha sp.]|jgi:predicted kinase